MTVQVVSPVNEMLVREDARLIMLLTPPFTNSKHDPGYIQGYLPGVRENGAQYTHAALWVALATAMLMAILYGLTPDDKWNARFNPQRPAASSGWAAIIGVVLALLIGAGVLMATIAFSGQRYFEYQIEEARKISQ